VREGRVSAVLPYPADIEATPIGQSLLQAQDPGCRIPQPMVRAGYLRDSWRSEGRGRGVEPFVPVDWEQAIELAAAALTRVRDEFGNDAIYGGSYGWGSAGRFHHAQSQVHRFLNLFGGYTRSVNTYSAAAAEVIMPHVLGIPFMKLVYEAPTSEDVARHTKTMLLFGGSAMKNTQVNAGGLGAHSAGAQWRKMRDAGVRVINVSPVRDDIADFVGAEWWACRPNSDVAIMLGLAHTLYQEDLHDRDFLARYCVGFEAFEPYLTGQSDGIAKSADWAAAIAGIPADEIRAMARTLASGRSILGISWSLQRQEHGEQPYWMITVLAAMLGQIGLPGGGVAYGYGCIHNMGFSGRRRPPFRFASLPQGVNPVDRYIPVSRVADMLLHPGEEIDYNGRRIEYPDVRLIYWAGGNPFHHHQDLNRLRRAWSRPETIIVNEPFWTATARHADIVFPASVPLERNDFGGGSDDVYISPMRQAVAEYADGRSDFAIFTRLAARLGFESAFTEGRDEMEWVRHLYATTRDNAAAQGIELPPFEEFWAGAQFHFGDQVDDQVFTLEHFRSDPDRHALRTPSGRIEIFSATIEAFAYEDCRGHPRWYDKQAWADAEQFPLHLVSNQPRTRLHSQFDHADVSRAEKIHGRETLRMHPADVMDRGLEEGQVVRVFNGRGACLAGLKCATGLARGTVELPTGAWYQAQSPECPESLEVHGNPNVLTPDRGTSRLAQGPTAHSCMVEVEAYAQELPEIDRFRQPQTVAAGQAETRGGPR